MKTDPRLSLVAIPLSLLAVACSEVAPDTPQSPTDRTVVLDIDANLPILGEDFVYEGWIVADRVPVSTGRFAVDGTGLPQENSFTLDEELAIAGNLFVLTIEPAVGDDPAPSETHLMAGSFEQQTVSGEGEITIADLSMEHPAALGTDFSEASGTFILETPTTSEVGDDYSQGIWWLAVSEDHELSPALELPELPEGWVYEGWVVGEDGPITTGRFSFADEADSDGAGATAGPDSSPPFPGQDFIDPAVDLVGMTAVISVEPQPDDSPAPFALKPLIDMEIEDVGAATTQALDNQSAPLLPARAVILR